MEEASRYVFFADRWHWTPQQVDDMPVYLAERMPAVAALGDEVNEEKQKAKMPSMPS